MMIKVIKNQYEKCLKILNETIENYPEELWFDKENYKYPAWQVAYHALLYGNIYASPSEEAIIHWPKEIENYEFFGKTPWPPYTKIEITRSYTKEDLLDFTRFLLSNLEKYLEAFDPEKPCWPFWYDENQLEFQINNIRHIQHHTAEIIERADIISTFSYQWI